MKSSLVITAWLGLLLSRTSSADPTWPATTDELEDYMFVTQGYGASGFAAHVIPCTASEFGPGRQVSAEWIRVGFHDMATTNVYYATVGVPHGGIDASLMFELNSGENVGDGFASSLTTYGQFFSKRTSVADLIALGVSTATRSCGGPLVPVKPGRIDATAAGPLGVPQPQNSLFTFQSQFQRMGFTTSEMILMTACGHTVGGVHAGNFPTIVIPGTVANDYAFFDDTTGVFDDHIATQYLGGTTTDPLSVGPCVSSTRCSDKVTFNGDSNATISTINTPTTFATNCQSIFQRMIETVPPTVTLGAALAPYTVKPYSLQLTLLSGGSSIKFEGQIRVRTTTGAVASVQLIYLNRSGGTGGTITTTVAGTSQGFDDTFTFYGFSTTLDATTSISSFNIQVTYTTGGVTTYDNNGSGYLIQDSVMYLAPQSCLSSSGSMTVVAAVRNTIVTAPTVDVSLKTARSGIPVPALSNSSLAMTKGATIGAYTLYSASTTLTSDQLSNTQFDVSAGTAKDQFKTSSGMGAVCSPLGSSASSSTTSSTTSSTSTTSSRTSTTTTSSAPSQTAPAHKPTIGAYTFQGCYTEGDGVRALSGATFIDYTSMTLETCATNCAAFTYWGVEYSGECYCGNSLGTGSVLAALADCSFTCPGNPLEYCGAGNRLEMYGKVPIASSSSSSSSSRASSTTSTSTSTSRASSTLTTSTRSSSTTSTTSTSRISTTSTTSSSTPTSTTPTQPQTVGSYTFYSCMTEATNARALTGATYAYDTMTLSSCAANCTGFTYFGTEYGRECYCGNSFSTGSVQVDASQCSMLCAGDSMTFCGAGDRLSVYVLRSAGLSVSSSSTSSTMRSSSTTSRISTTTSRSSSSSSSSSTSRTSSSSRTSTTSRISSTSRSSSSTSRSSTITSRSSTTSRTSSTTRKASSSSTTTTRSSTTSRISSSPSATKSK